MGVLEALKWAFDNEMVVSLSADPLTFGQHRMAMCAVYNNDFMWKTWSDDYPNAVIQAVKCVMNQPGEPR